MAHITIKGSLEVKLPTIWTNEATEVGKEEERRWREDAGSTFLSQKVQSISAPEHFWKLRCLNKGARHRGARRISKSKCQHLGFAAILEVKMFKKCMPLWRKAHFEVNM